MLTKGLLWVNEVGFIIIIIIIITIIIIVVIVITIMHSFISLFVDPSIHPSIHSSFVCRIVHSFVHLLLHHYLSIRPLAHSPINLSIHYSLFIVHHSFLLSINPSIDPCTHQVIHPSIHVFVHFLIRSFHTLPFPVSSRSLTITTSLRRGATTYTPFSMTRSNQYPTYLSLLAGQQHPWEGPRPWAWALPVTAVQVMM